MIRHRRSPQKPAHTCMGLDASLNSTGYAYYDARGTLVTGRILPGTKRGAARLHHNLTQLLRVWDAAQPQVIALEGYAMGIKGGRVFQLGEWGGVIRLEAWKRGIEVLVVTPSTLKYAATGNGAAKKPPMMQACIDLFGTEIKQDDEADAFLLLKVHAARVHGQGPKDFVHRVLNPKDSKKPGYTVEPGARLAVCN